MQAAGERGAQQNFYTMVDKIIYCGSPLRLFVQNNWLILSGDNEKRSLEAAENRVSWEDIGFIELDHPQITLSFSVFQTAASRSIPILVSDTQHLPGGLFLPAQGHSSTTKSSAAQVMATVALRKRIWKQVVQAKLHNQAQLMASLGEEAAQRRLSVLARSVKSGDHENKEAQGARVYWKAFGKALETKFSREPQAGHWPNNLLDYGYAILRAYVARACITSGLLPQIGLFHHNQFDPFPLANDLMEPYRPLVDRLVLHTAHNLPATDQLQKEHKRELLYLPTLRLVQAGQQMSMANAIRRSTASLASCFLGENRSIQLPKLY